MSSAKKIFIQSMMISTGILFLNGIIATLRHFAGQGDEMMLMWYHPMSIIMTGLICALPTVLLKDRDSWDRKTYCRRIALHGLTLYAAVILAGWLLEWYTDPESFIGISVVFLLVYAFVWLASHWIDKRDEKMINQALAAIRDHE